MYLLRFVDDNENWHDVKVEGEKSETNTILRAYCPICKAHHTIILYSPNSIHIIEIVKTKKERCIHLVAIDKIEDQT